MVSCSKCDFRDAVPGSSFCSSCREGINRIYELTKPVPGEVDQPRPPGRFVGPSSILGVRVPRATGHDRAPVTLPRTIERVPVQLVLGDLLKDILKATLESPPQLPAEALAGKAPRAPQLQQKFRDVGPIEIDHFIRYVGAQRKIELDESGLNDLSAATAIDTQVLRYLLVTHGHCHEAMRRSYEKMRGTVGPEYDNLDNRIREHYSQLVMYYLLFAPDWVRHLLGDEYDDSLLEESHATGFRRDFMALNTLQSGYLYVDPPDFTKHPPTATIENGVRFPAHRMVNSFEQWHQAVIGRSTTECAHSRSQ